MKHAVYFDNAATSWPKPPQVLSAVVRAARDIGASPGRGGYRAAQKADRLVYEARLTAAALFNAPDPARVIFTPGATVSLNIAIGGLLKSGDHVIATGRQHNAVIRTLYAERAGFKVSRFAWDGAGPITERDIRPLVRRSTRALVVNHACNVDGLVYPIEALGKAARELGLLLIVDAAQSAGTIPIDMRLQKISALCVSGHKGLWGPPGTGLLILGEGVDAEPVLYGGTGSFSEDRSMPRAYPDRLEPGTPNLWGIAGLSAGMRLVLEAGVSTIGAKKAEIADHVFDQLAGIKRVRLFRPARARARMPVFSFVIGGMGAGETADTLDRRYGIACRAGLHCAADAHRELGTFPEGTVRFAPGWRVSKRDAALFVRAVRELAGGP